MRVIVWMIGAISVFGPGGLSAQSKSNDTTARYFIIQASIGNLQEIAMARVAEDQAVSPEVKAFARKMIADHGKTEAQLLQLIRWRNFQIPPQALDTPIEDPILKSTPQKDFDRVYVHMMAAGHGQTEQLYESYVFIGKDPDVVAFARQTLPVIKEHLESITAIANGINSQHVDQ